MASSLAFCYFFDIFYCILNILLFGTLEAAHIYDIRIGSRHQCRNQVYKPRKRQHVNIFVAIAVGEVEEECILQISLDNSNVLYISQVSQQSPPELPSCHAIPASDVDACAQTALRWKHSLSWAVETEMQIGGVHGYLGNCLLRNEAIQHGAYIVGPIELMKSKGLRPKVDQSRAY